MHRMHPPLQDTIFDAFSIIDDPRAANASHPLIDVLFCLIVAVCCGADSFVAAELIANERKAFIKRYVRLRRGVPSHNTMGQVLGSIDPKQFVAAFADFMERLTGRPRKDIINLDGKSLRGVVGAANTRDPDAVSEQVHMLSAFSAVRRIVLAQIRSEQVANEVKPAHDLLQLIELKGSVVTLDAAHSNQKAFEIIAERGGDAVVAIKANTPKIVSDVARAFKTTKPKLIRTEERTHGATETRTYEFVAAKGEHVEENFPSVKMFIRVTRDNVSHAAKQQRDDREMYYVATFDDIDLAAECVRKRWSIENGLHYVLDVTFKEDGSRIRTKNAAENFSRVRHIAFGLLSLKKTAKKLSFPMKRFKAAMDDRFLASLLRLPPP
jgi:predicted transposase YbfD/YdcC